MEAPETRYARAGGGYVAYQVWGEGPDLVATGGAWGVDALWDHPRTRQALERLGSFARNIWYDQRGSGSSSRTVDGRQNFGLEPVLEDIAAVSAAAGAGPTALLAISEGAAASALYAATYPERVSSLVIVNGAVRFLRGEDYPVGVGELQLERFARAIESDWDQPDAMQRVAPSMADDHDWLRWWQRARRLLYAPDDAGTAWTTTVATDTHHVLSAIQAPTLVLHRRGNRHALPEHGRYLAEQIPGAVHRELDGDDHMFFAGDVDALLDEIQEFVTGAPPVAPTNRVLVTVVFTDIVGSSATAVDLGDARWRTLLDAHDAVVRNQLARYGGREVNTTGDGFVATFDGPARAIRCAVEVVDAVRSLGIDLRVGVHTGEVELRGDDIGGVAVNLASRVQSLAEPGEVLVSRTVTDLVAGSGLAFADRGEHELRGIPGRWNLFSVLR